MDTLGNKETVNATGGRNRSEMGTAIDALAGGKVTGKHNAGVVGDDCNGDGNGVRREVGNVVGDVVIVGVDKHFTRRTSQGVGYDTIKSRLFDTSSWRWRRRQSKRAFTALNNINLSIPSGSALGIIGRNGSGKSTMLKLICGIYQPDGGHITVNGRISALIELGAGFHPDFTGRENVYLGGVMYGLTRKQIDERFKDIVSFAELEDYIDDPVRTYSSGMFMRLGFSLAVYTDPDILLIDEVLAVGDAAFTHRCHDVLNDFKRRGKTLIFVTHDLSAVERWCDEAVWLDGGKVALRGEPRRVIDAYLQRIEQQEDEALLKDGASGLPSGELDGAGNAGESAGGVGDGSNDGAGDAARDASAQGAETRWGSLDVELTDLRMKNKSGVEKRVFNSEEEVIVEVDYTIHKPVAELVFGVGILRGDGVVVFGGNTAIERLKVPLNASCLAAQMAGETRPQVAAQTAERLTVSPATVENVAEGAQDTKNTHTPAVCYEPHCGTYVFTIHRIGLNEGTYYIDVASHKLDGTPYDYHHRRHRFSVRTTAPFHGIYNPVHTWGFVSVCVSNGTGELEDA